MNEDVEKVFTALGALCEIAGFLRDHLMDNGFTREEACSMALEYILEMSISNGGKPNG